MGLTESTALRAGCLKKNRTANCWQKGGDTGDAARASQGTKSQRRAGKRERFFGGTTKKKTSGIQSWLGSPSGGYGVAIPTLDKQKIPLVQRRQCSGKERTAAERKIQGYEFVRKG